MNPLFLESFLEVFIASRICVVPVRDMDPFGENDHDLVDKREDEDPAAAFIAQERDQLAGLGDDDLEDGFNASKFIVTII